MAETNHNTSRLCIDSRSLSNFEFWSHHLRLTVAPAVHEEGNENPVKTNTEKNP